MTSVKTSPFSPPSYLEPTEVYNLPGQTNAPIRLRIATGGAGQSGLIRALAVAFIDHHTTTASVAPFSVAWCASDTTISFNSLAQRGADLAITYHALAEATAVSQSMTARRAYAWRDHWMLVGPRTNPAKLPVISRAATAHQSGLQTLRAVHALFIMLFKAAIATATSPNPVRFLSRNDKSAANIREASFWAGVGQAPWADPASAWYHRFAAFPYEALAAAARLGEYTIVDRGTWYGVDGWVREAMSVFIEGGDEVDDPLLNPAHALVGVDGENKDMAHAFVDWLVDPKGGQEVIRTFTSKNGIVLYSTAPQEDGNREYEFIMSKL